MDKLFLNSFRRIYSDNGKNDVDFTEQEARLRKSKNNLTEATKALVRASEKLNNAALNILPAPKSDLH